MSDFPAPSGAETSNPAFANAVQRAKEIASKIRPGSGPPPALPTPTTSLKRSFEDPFEEGPNQKKPFSESSRKMMDPSDFSNLGMGGPGGTTTEIIMVPDKMVGLIIGRGGEQITRLQAESGCKIQMAQDSQGMPERQCTLTGAPGAIAQARASIERIIANEGSGPPRMGGGGGGPGGHMGGGGGMSGGGCFEMSVPGHKVGLIIGKGGETIKQLQERSGAKIIIIQDSAELANEKPLRITGDPNAVETAKQLVTEILNQNDERDMGGFGGGGGGRGGGRGGRGGAGIPRGGGGRGGFMGGGRGGAAGRGGRGGFGGWSGGNEYGAEHTDYVTIPATKCGLVIGKGGETIKNINSSTGAHCEVDKSAPPDAREKNFVIRGTPEAVERAKAMIMEKIGMPVTASTYGSYGGSSSGGGSWGGAGDYAPSSYPGGDSVNINPSTGQADYSAQWADYYRSMGMVREAEAIEAQMRGGQTRGPSVAPTAALPAAAAPGPPSSNGAPQNGGGADYSAQWAEYYRSIGKVKEAEAIEAQMKQKVAAPSPGQYGGATYYGGPGAQPGNAPVPGYPTGYPNYGGQSGPD